MSTFVIKKINANINAKTVVNISERSKKYNV